MSQHRLLLVAYQCGPGLGSVSQIGWEWYARLAQQQPLTLVTHVRNKAALTTAGAPFPGSDILYIDTEWFAGPLYRLARRLFPRSEHSVFLLSSLDYFLFDFVAYRRLRTAMSAGQSWELIHRVTPVTQAAPTWLGRLGLPLIVGPLNSGLKDPQGFAQIMRQESTWLLPLRGLGKLLDSLIGSTRRASRLLIATRSTLKSVSPRYHERCIPMIENGVDLSQFHATPWPAAPNHTQALRVLFVGRLIPAKALDILLHAIALLKEQGAGIHLSVIGEGPMRQDWERLSHELKLSDYVCFMGAKPSHDVAQAISACHVLCLPSVRESGGAVLLEAMASARPVIAMNYGGPAEVVNPAVGSLVNMTNPEQARAGIARELKDIIDHPASWAARGNTGRRRAEACYSWSAKVFAATRLYAEVIAERDLQC